MSLIFAMMTLGPRSQSGCDSLALTILGIGSFRPDRAGFVGERVAVAPRLNIPS